MQQHKAGFWQRLKLALNQPKDSVVYRTSEGVWYHPLGAGVLHRPEYRNFRHLQHYAMLSAYAYSEEDASTGPIKLPDGCRLVADVTNPDSQEDKGQSVKGLRYQVWHWEQERQLIIAFRGTGKRLGDWFSNFRWVTRFIPGVYDHYDLVRNNINSVIADATASVGDVDQIVTTGHSLGGGLAQQAAYGCDAIKTVYAFNPTPVTGYRNMEEDVLMKNRKDIFIARVFEHGEVLAYMRLGLRQFYKISAKDPQIVELRFNFSKTIGVLKEHGMESFAVQVGKLQQKPVFN